MYHSLSSINRPLGLRLRADLLATPVEMSGAPTWVVKDPLTLEHFQFSVEEYALMDWLRADTTIADVEKAYNRKFAPQTISPNTIWEFVSRLHSAGLLISDSAGQGHELLARRERETVRRWGMSWTQILGIRFRGIDPDSFLTFLHEEFRWLFSPAALVAALALVLYALSLVFGHFAEFQSRLPELSALIDWRNLPWLLLAIGAVKILHEFGHALTCKHFGGEVHEMGLMLLVFAPCLYCDVSDAWRMPSKWQRIAISAAGIVVELVVAAAATIVWWYAVPGVVQLVALNIMVICTVSTLAINGNPLLRYDGYYILSDLVEVPNLWQRSRDALRRFWSSWILGQPVAEDPLVPARQRPWLAAYALVSKIYLAVLCVAIVWGIANALYPYHLQNLAYAVGLTVFGSALVGPITSAMQLARNPIRRAEVRKGRLALVTAIGLAATVAVLAIPVDYRVSAPLVLMPDDAARVYATAEGTLLEVLPAGSRVKRGDVIGKLENTETAVELARLESECSLRKLRIEHLERLRGVDREANDQLPTVRTALADSERRLAERLSESKRLTLTAPADGTIIPAPRIVAAGGSPAATQGRLPTWSGSLLEPAARGAYVQPGALVCLVGDPKVLTAVMLVDDVDVKWLEPGQRARLRIDQLPGQVIDGEVIEIARHKTDEPDGARAARADLSPLYAGMIAPGNTGALYEARVRFNLEANEERGARSENAEATRSSLLAGHPLGGSSPLIIGGRGEAKVTVERITLGRRIVRYLAQTFRLPM